jgi:hypothetical protein
MTLELHDSTGEVEAILQLQAQSLVHPEEFPFWEISSMI